MDGKLTLQNKPTQIEFQNRTANPQLASCVPAGTKIMHADQVDVSRPPARNALRVARGAIAKASEPSAFVLSPEPCNNGSPFDKLRTGGPLSPPSNRTNMKSFTLTKIVFACLTTAVLCRAEPSFEEGATKHLQEVTKGDSPGVAVLERRRDEGVASIISLLPAIAADKTEAHIPRKREMPRARRQCMSMMRRAECPNALGRGPALFSMGWL